MGAQPNRWRVPACCAPACCARLILLHLHAACSSPSTPPHRKQPGAPRARPPPPPLQGTQDEVIDIEHGRKLYKLCKNPAGGPVLQAMERSGRLA